MTVCSIKLLVAEARGSGWTSMGKLSYWIISSPIRFKYVVRPCVCSVAQLFSLLWAHGLKPTRHLCPWNFPARSTGVGSRALLHGIFQTQGSNLCLLDCRQIPYHWATGEAHSLALDNGIYWAPFPASTINTFLPLFTPASPEDRTKFPRK